MLHLGNFFREARSMKSMTQSQVAEEARIDEKHYGRIERSECTNLTLSTFLNICKVLDIKAAEELSKIIGEL